MAKDVLIKIKGVYKVEGDENTEELFTNGKMYIKNNCTYLTYKESETTGFEGCTTTLKIEEDGRVTIMRIGPTSSTLILQPGLRNIGRYTVCGNQMEIGVFAETLECETTESNAKLHMTYSIDMNSVLLSENELYIDADEIK